MNIRKVALAIATASSVALAGTAVAGAQTDDQNTTAGSQQDAGSTKPEGSTAPEGSKTSTGSSRLGDWLGADGELTGDDIFGSDKKADIKAWGALLSVGLLAGVVGTIASVVIGIGNYLKHEGIIR